ncbi:MAG: Na+/H+ antiporter subunit C [Spirochaetes bacterium]|nr:MAG: Na+/H+ antiporter subunit C [Spirochaetota bacterium]
MPAIILLLIFFIIGLGGVLMHPNLIKKMIGLSIMNTAIVIFFIYFGSLSGSQAPILVEGVKDIVDPVPQALMLTAIVIGVALTALGLALIYRIYNHYETLNIKKIQKKFLIDD